MIQLFNCSGADTLASDNSDMNPFMLAVERGNLIVAKAMVKKNSDLISMKMVHWALEKHLNTFFQVSLPTSNNVINSSITDIRPTYVARSKVLLIIYCTSDFKTVDTAHMHIAFLLVMITIEVLNESCVNLLSHY